MRRTAGAKRVVFVNIVYSHQLSSFSFSMFRSVNPVDMPHAQNAMQNASLEQEARLLFLVLSKLRTLIHRIKHALSSLLN